MLIFVFSEAVDFQREKLMTSRTVILPPTLLCPIIRQGDKPIELEICYCLYYLFKNGPFPSSFSFRLFCKQLTVNKCSIKVADDWFCTWVLWYRKRPLCQLRHSTALLLLFVI